MKNHKYNRWVPNEVYMTTTTGSNTECQSAVADLYDSLSAFDEALAQMIEGNQNIAEAWGIPLDENGDIEYEEDNG